MGGYQYTERDNGYPCNPRASCRWQCTSTREDSNDSKDDSDDDSNESTSHIHNFMTGYGLLVRVQISSSKSYAASVVPC